VSRRSEPLDPAPRARSPEPKIRNRSAGPDLGRHVRARTNPACGGSCRPRPQRQGGAPKRRATRKQPDRLFSRRTCACRNVFPQQRRLKRIKLDQLCKKHFVFVSGTALRSRQVIQTAHVSRGSK
jgi:hypothetical protein